MNAILSRLVYCRILFPGSKRSTCRLSKNLLEQPGFEYHQMERTLSVIAAEFDGFYAVETNPDDDVRDILAITTGGGKSKNPSVL